VTATTQPFRVGGDYPSMPNRWWWLPALAIAGCYADPDHYAARQAQVLCDLQSECDREDHEGWWDFGVDLEHGESCVDARKRELHRCNESCNEYDGDAARECIDELKRAARADECSLESVDFAVCARVFTDCEIEDADDPLHCDVEAPFHVPISSCSLAPDAVPPAGLFALLFFCFVRRARTLGQR
jgi:hypothetical protein